MLLPLALVALASTQLSASQPLVIEACRIRLTEPGRRANFQTTFIYQVSTDGAGRPGSIERVKMHLEEFVEMAKFEECIRRWQLAPNSRYVVTLFVGTTGRALANWRIGLGNPSGTSFSVLLPPD